MNSHLLRLFFFAVPIVSVFSSNALVPLVVLVAAIISVLRGIETKTIPSFTRNQIIIFSLFFSWVTISTFWAISPWTAFKLDLRLIALTIAGLVLVNAVTDLDKETRKRTANAVLLGVVLASILLCIEVFYQAPITKVFKGKALDAWVDPSRFNRGATFIGISLWILCAIFRDRLSLFFKLLFPFVPIVLLYFAPSESSLVAVILGAIWYFLFFRSPKRGFQILPVIMIVSVLAMPFATRYVEPLYDAKSSHSIPFSAKHRFFIWDFVSSQILKNPVIGSGFDSARDYPNNGVENYVNIEPNGNIRAVGGRIISLHPHNFALQVWLELGLIGALLVSMIIWTVFRYLKSRQLAERIEIQAMLVSTFIIALLGYGIWQNRWFVMFFIFAAMIPLIQQQEHQDNIGEVDEYGA
ncbi:O-antigen ligase family protein [Kiloniella majae]|uniref:O-antigen ligase family protein n=1 Tax=Kiloniella majae TaxID=1938558 RepID=UPI000A278284|nr:O-antigen ligase family protein [Kiloniella majae]